MANEKKRVLVRVNSDRPRQETVADIMRIIGSPAGP